MELKGPLLPHVLPLLCSLMKSSQLEQYSASCAGLQSTTSFSAMKNNFGKYFFWQNYSYLYKNYMNTM